MATTDFLVVTFPNAAKKIMQLRQADPSFDEAYKDLLEISDLRERLSAAGDQDSQMVDLVCDSLSELTRELKVRLQQFEMEERSKKT